MAKAPAENHFYNSLRLNDGGLGMTTPDVAYWPLATDRIFMADGRFGWIVLQNSKTS
jgi:hypothetical protein